MIKTTWYNARAAPPFCNRGGASTEREVALSMPNQYTTTEPFADRFWGRVDKSGDCWLWTGARNSNGYGNSANPNPGGSRMAHRIAWELTYGPIPHSPGAHGTCVLHHCDNPPCVRPDHLFLGTNLDNARDRDRKGRNPNHPGETNGRAKLTADQVRAIRARYNGNNAKTMAREYGIGQMTVWRILHRETWRHVQ